MIQIIALYRNEYTKYMIVVKNLVVNMYYIYNIIWYKFHKRLNNPIDLYLGR